MAFDPAEGIPLLEFHLSRLKESARELGFEFDRHAARNELQAATFCLTGKSRVRLLLSRGGAMALEIREHRTWPEAVMKVAMVERDAATEDVRLRHKTTDRAIYREALSRGGTYEVVMTDADGFLTEGCFSNIFVERGSKLATPPLSRGVLPGVLRASLIEAGEAFEADLTPLDLDKGFFLGNAARGMVTARLA